MRTGVLFWFAPNNGVKISFAPTGTVTFHHFNSLSSDLNRKLLKCFGNKHTKFWFYRDHIIKEAKTDQLVGITTDEKSFLQDCIDMHEFTREPNCNYLNEYSDDDGIYMC